jgi:hypothetical protein
MSPLLIGEEGWQTLPKRKKINEGFQEQGDLSSIMRNDSYLRMRRHELWVL